MEPPAPHATVNAAYDNLRRAHDNYHMIFLSHMADVSHQLEDAKATIKSEKEKKIGLERLFPTPRMDTPETSALNVLLQALQIQTAALEERRNRLDVELMALRDRRQGGRLGIRDIA